MAFIFGYAIRTTYRELFPDLKSSVTRERIKELAEEADTKGLELKYYDCGRSVFITNLCHLHLKDDEEVSLPCGLEEFMMQGMDDLRTYAEENNLEVKLYSFKASEYFDLDGY